MTNRDAAIEAAAKEIFRDIAISLDHARTLATRAIAAYEQALAKDGLEPRGCPTPGACSCPSPAADVKATRDEISRILGPQGTPSGPGLLNILTEYVVANSSADVKALREKIINLIDGHIEAHLGFITSPAKVLKMLRTDILTLLDTSRGEE